MVDAKFSDDEREPVIERIETLKGIKLKPVGTKKIFLKGSDDLYYCVVGGRGDWHAIPEEVMDQEKKERESVSLVIARWLRTRIEVYEGLLKPLFDSRGSLSSTCPQMAFCPLLKSLELNSQKSMSFLHQISAGGKRFQNSRSVNFSQKRV